MQDTFQSLRQQKERQENCSLRCDGKPQKLIAGVVNLYSVTRLTAKPCEKRYINVVWEKKPGFFLLFITQIGTFSEMDVQRNLRKYVGLALATRYLSQSQKQECAGNSGSRLGSAQQCYISVMNSNPPTDLCMDKGSREKGISITKLAVHTSAKDSDISPDFLETSPTHKSFRTTWPQAYKLGQLPNNQNVP